MRHSRTPAGITAAEAEVLVKSAEANEGLKDTIEKLLGKKWSTLTYGEKVKALSSFDTVGRAAGALAGAARGLRDATNEANLAVGDVEARDRVVLLETQVADLKAQIETLTRQNKTLRQQITAQNASSARAVNSGERGAA